MNIKQTFMLAASITAAAMFASCNKDDYSPIYLVEAETQATFEGNELSLIFNKEKKFLIRGGKGNYTVSVADMNVLDFRYDGDTLTYRPESIGTTESTIADRSGNSYTLNVSVENPQAAYSITKIEAEAAGGDLTQAQTEELQNKIIQESPAKVGGRIQFTYSDENCTSGDIKIYPEATGGYQVGIFTQTRKYDENTGKEQLRIETTMAGEAGEKYTFVVSPQPMGRVRFEEVVTDRYKGSYPALTEARRIYHLKAAE